MHAVACAVDVAARDTLVRLHHVEMLAPPRIARGAGERPVAPQVADVERVDAQEAPRAPAAFFARDQRELGARALERGQRASDETLGAAVRTVALSDQSNLHCASSSRAAACTASTGRNARHSESLPPPQPS